MSHNSDLGQTIKVVVITAVVFGIYYALQKMFFAEIRSWFYGFVPSLGISHFVAYVIVGTPLFVGVGIIHGFRNFPEVLGLNKSIVKGASFALLCALPMLIGFAIVFDFNSELTADKVLLGAVFASLMEELFFRGVLFGQIFRYTRIGFILSILFGALIFATAHLYQSQDLATLIGIFVTTFMGAVLFAWLYVEWNYNLWVPIFLHLFMNLFWMMFSAADNAFGGVYANVFRIITIVLAIGLTVMYKLKKGIRFEVNKKTLLIKRTGEV